MTIFETSSESETTAIASQIASTAKAGDIFLLNAPMGAGKSVFARGFIKTLCGENTEVPSPTFTIVQTYDTPIAPIWHFDLYRIEQADDVFNIGWDDAIDGANICLIEWPQKAGNHIPHHAIQINIDIVSEHKRKISIYGI